MNKKIIKYTSLSVLFAILMLGQNKQAGAKWLFNNDGKQQIIDDPFFTQKDQLFELQNNMDKVFEDFRKSFKTMPLSNFEAFKMDVKEKDDRIEVTAELPGMKKEDIDLSLSETYLSIKSEKKSSKEETNKDSKDDKNTKYYMQEISYGAFNRIVLLPVKVDITKYKASFENGILKVELNKLPKIEEEKKITKLKID